MFTEYIIIKDISRLNSALQLENSDWFNLWSDKQEPYRELREGDIIYWLDN